jgi:hypothetical protein
MTRRVENPEGEVGTMTRWQLLLGTVVTILWAGRACAVSTETQLTPNNPMVNGLLFTVTVQDAGPYKDVEVVVKPEAGRELSPFLGSQLSLYEGKKLVLSCPVEKKQSKGELRYRFSVSSEDLHKVRFAFNEYAHAKMTDKTGVVTVVPMPAVDRYWFDLKDFAGGK